MPNPLPQTPWGALLAVYFVLVGLPSGLTLAGLWHRGRWPGNAVRVERWTTWTALAVLTAASVLLVVDLGRPERFFLMVTSLGNLGSPISVGAKIIALKVFVLAVAAYLLPRRYTPAGTPRPYGNAAARVADGTVVTLLVITSLALAVYPVSVLARGWVAPLAGTSGAALIFLLTALLMGAAGLLAIHALAPGGGRLEPAVHAAAPGGGRAEPAVHALPGGGRADPAVHAGTLTLLAGYAVAIAFEWLAVRDDPVAAPAVAAGLSTAGGAVIFWGLVVGVGLVLPAAGLLAVPARRWALLTVAAAILVGASAGRYLIFAVS